MNRFFCPATFALFCAISAFPQQKVSFHREIRPILERSCRVCHQEANRGGGLSVASVRDMLDGHAITAGDAKGSALVKQISGEPPKMPKAGKRLTPEEVSVIARWIDEGAKDDSPSQAKKEVWWSLRPLIRPAVPAAGKEWAKTPIDSFIRAGLSAKGLDPSQEADRRTLLRRVTIDLHGLPPSMDEMDAFLADRSPNAYEKVVDRLLASPRYGERWARHWLDVVHYGDTHGYDKDKPRPNAWPYRDYVIGAFNMDKPYANFVEEQLAGDVLYPGDAGMLAATGFIAAGPWDFVGHQELREGTTDKNITRSLDRDDMVAATVSTFSSMTAHCARCHDHKFDPIKQTDYYSLQAVFAGVDRADRPFDVDPAVFQARRKLLEEKRVIYRQLQPLLDKVENASSEQIVALDNRIQDGKLLLAHIGKPKNNEDAAKRKALQERVEADTKRRKELVDEIVGAQTYAEIDRLRSEAARVDAEIKKLPEPRYVYTASNFFPIAGKFRPALTPRPVHLLARGSVTSPQELMQPGALSAVPELPSRFAVPDGADEGARRRELARWIVDRNNMLTWRSAVNRVWHHHFGAGIVDTPNDFGRMGSQPSHPELLDWLAVWFRDDARGSLKQLHRMIVVSAVYRQSSIPREDGVKADADNRLLWRMNRTRLDAETVRDSVLAVTGKIDLTMGGPGVRMFLFKDDHSPVYDYARYETDAPGAYRRSIYRFVVRSAPDPFMERLDCPDPSILSPKRNTTLTAIQALALMNNPFMVRMAEHMEAKVRSMQPDAGAQPALAVRLILGREMTQAEQRDFSAYATKHGMANLCRLLFNTNEFLFAD